MPRKVRELIRDLERAGFYQVPAKHGHKNFRHTRRPGRVTVPGKPGDHVKHYLEKQVREAIREVSDE